MRARGGWKHEAVHIAAIPSTLYLNASRQRGSGWLACGMNSDESLDAAQKRLADLCSVEKAAGRHGAVAEHDEVLGCGLGHGFLNTHH